MKGTKTMSKYHTYPEERKQDYWNKAAEQAAKQTKLRFHYRYFWKSMTNPAEMQISYGLCSPNFATHRATNSPHLWRITHRPTGFCLPWLFAKQKHAKQAIIQLELNDSMFPVSWTSSDPRALEQNSKATFNLLKPYLLKA